MYPKNLIRNYLTDEGILIEEIKDAKFKFEYKFTYPPSAKGQKITIVRLQEKDYILIFSGVQIPDQFIKIITKFKDAKKYQLFNDLKKIFILKDYFYKIDIPKYRFEISDQLFFKTNGYISKNTLFQGLRKLYSCIVYSKIVIEEYCMVGVKTNSRESMNYDFSLFS